MLLEIKVSRLYGHSSADGASFRDNEEDVLKTFRAQLTKAGVVTESEVDEIYKKYQEESHQAVQTVRSEPVPAADTVWDHTYVNSENADWRNF